MKYTSLVFSGVIATFAVAAPASKSGGTLSLPISRKLLNGSTGTVDKRDVDMPFDDLVLRYIATLEFGTPGQSIDLIVDTGSSDAWVFGPGSEESGGIYDPSRSSSYKFLNDDFDAGYVKGSATGSWATDDVTILDYTIKAQQFGVVNASEEIPYGILGIARQEREQANPKYDNFNMNLVKQGIISSNTYSIYLDNVNSKSGAVLFGGIDHAKYTGSLFELPFQHEYKFLLDVSIQGYGGQFVVLLDTGTSFTFVPQDVLEAIADDLGATYNNNSGYYEFDQVPDEKELIFDFGAGQIKVSSSALIQKGSDFNEVEDSKYYLAMKAQTRSYGYLGDSFLRSAYVFFNLDNMTASIAQASYSDDSQVVPW